ncbi:MAG: Transposase, partial [Anaerolineales bacterium]|nr:Transposase [Anaerolineales bacterium]
MTLGSTPRQADLFRTSADFCAPRIAPDSIWAPLHRECFTLLPDELFDDLFDTVGRRSIPPLIVAVVMVLQGQRGWQRGRCSADFQRYDASVTFSRRLLGRPR